MRRTVLLLLAIAVAGCGPPLTASSSSATVPVSQAGTFTYSLTFIDVPAQPAGCNPQAPIDDLAENGCLTLAVSCAGQPFSLTSDGGSVEPLAASGTLYLGTGNWTGKAAAPCAWTLTLTPQ